MIEASNIVYINYIFIISIVLTIIIIFFSWKTGIFIDGLDKSHGIHSKPTPRAGGIAIFIASSFMIFNPLGLLLYISSIPAFLSGFLEDFLKDISPKKRFILMILSSILAILLLNTLVYDIEYIHFPLIIAALFTIIGICGVINAINLIDGLNGLASGIGMLTLFSFAYVSYIYNDLDLLIICLILSAAIAGFFILNFPKGFIFLGDSGSYFIGFVLGVLSILIVNRHPEISPWFPLLVLIYPVWEAIFSMMRRKFIYKTSMFTPDNNHLHCMLSYKIGSNPLASVILLNIVLIFDVIAIIFRENTLVLTSLSFIFIIVYTVLYAGISVLQPIRLRYYRRLLSKFRMDV